VIVGAAQMRHMAAMNVQMSRLAANQRSPKLGFAAILAWIFGKIGPFFLDVIDARLTTGCIHAILPDGSAIELGGSQFGERGDGWQCVVILHEWRGLWRLITGGSVGWYQAWEAGEWESPDPVALFALVAGNAVNLRGAARAHGPWRWAAQALHWARRNNRQGSLRNIHAHYDLGNEFYAAWLDPTMSYSSARFDGLDLGLQAAQRRKIAAIADRVTGARSVLEIGCGWGALAAELARRGADVTAISLSDAQLDWGRQQHGAAVDFCKQDYREVDGPFDAIVSVEMVEAVGQAYWPDYFECLARCLSSGGRAALQLISIRDELFEAYARSADFIQTYIFPGGMLVRETAFRQLATVHGLRWQDEHRFGLDYAETLRKWRMRFDAAAADGRLPAGFDARFIRLWRFYLMYCEGGFRGGAIDVVQVTLVKG
jgi:cyclopropane-fatty-acyl-phospholipid synthase